MTPEYSVMIPSRRPNLANQCKSTMPFIQNVLIVDSKETPSFSRVLNSCVQKSPTEIIIVCNDIVRPHTIHFDKMLNYIHRGYGIVFMCVNYFFGFKKDFIRDIGFFDERYIGDYCEGLDLEFRCKEADIAFFRSEEAPFVKLMYNKNDQTHLNKKWDYRYPKLGSNRTIPEYVTRKLKEEDYSYEIMGLHQESKFLKYQNSAVL
jgi:hypothetical protein